MSLPHSFMQQHFTNVNSACGTNFTGLRCMELIGILFIHKINALTVAVLALSDATLIALVIFVPYCPS